MRRRRKWINAIVLTFHLSGKRGDSRKTKQIVLNTILVRSFFLWSRFVTDWLNEEKRREEESSRNNKLMILFRLSEEQSLSYSSLYLIETNGKSVIFIHSLNQSLNLAISNDLFGKFKYFSLYSSVSNRIFSLFSSLLLGIRIWKF